MKRLRQHDLEPSPNHLEPVKLDEDNLHFTKDIERELLKFDQATKQLEPENTLLSMQELFPNDPSLEQALLNSIVPKEMEAMGLNENDHYSLKVNEKTLLFIVDLERELLEFDKESK